MIINYPHRRGIHCETGSIKNLLKFYGLDLPEELIFGIGSGLDFINFPFGFVPGTNESVIYRTRSTKILSQFSKRMNIKYKTHSFFSQKKAMDKLDSLLEKGIPAAILADIYLLPYFAEFSAGDRFPEHHAIVIGKENGEYIISDTHYLLRGGLSKITIDELRIARFAKAGLMSTRGRMYYITSVPKDFNIKLAIIKGIKETCYKMLDIWLPFFGVKGMYFLAKRMRRYEERYGTKNTWATLKMQLRLAEDAGTGGSGFRYVYSNFLEQAAEYFDNDPQLLSISDYFREIGDKRQLLALETIRQHEGRIERNVDVLADMNYAIAKMEQKAFIELRKWVKKQKI
ncbi:MAG: BtrH N-terminal domain-containing protein [Paludibacteraceae bacterium]|nr:BtrH N-terminal domain-containing protein [Paludibacteraceae bacterium]